MTVRYGPAMADTCIFCSIAAGDVDADVVLTTDSVVAFRDLAPKAEVHVLVVPRRHVRDVVELSQDPELLAAAVGAAGQVAATLADGEFRLVANTGATAGQSVFHAHLHVLAGAGAADGDAL